MTENPVVSFTYPFFFFLLRHFSTEPRPSTITLPTPFGILDSKGREGAVTVTRRTGTESSLDVVEKCSTNTVGRRRSERRVGRVLSELS